VPLAPFASFAVTFNVPGSDSHETENKNGRTEKRKTNTKKLRFIDS
jgi:hypothetical protein